MRLLSAITKTFYVECNQYYPVRDFWTSGTWSNKEALKGTTVLQILQNKRRRCLTVCRVVRMCLTGKDREQKTPIKVTYFCVGTELRTNENFSVTWAQKLKHLLMQ